MADFYFKKRRNQEGLMMILAMELYLRPGELDGIRVMDLVPPVGAAPNRQWSLVLHPWEQIVPSKAQEFDETVLFDLPLQTLLAETICRVLKFGVRGNHEKLFSLSYESMKEWMKKAADFHQVEAVGAPHAYRLRHAGASRDFALHLRSGRWKAPSSTRRYQKGGRLQQLLHLLPKDALQRALTAFERREATLRGVPCADQVATFSTSGFC